MILRHKLLLISILTISVIGMNGCTPSQDDSAMIGQPAPGFALPDLAGNEFGLEQARGNVVLIDFWATWCPPCLRALPHIQAIHARFEGKGLIVLGINNEDPAKVSQFATEKGLTFRTLSDPSGGVFDAYGVEGIPTTVLIDAEGVVRRVYVGYTAEEELLSALAELGVADTPADSHE